MKNGLRRLVMITLALLASSLVSAEEQVTIPSTSSGRLYADHTFGDCCTLDAWSSSSGSLWTETCETMVGYCMGGTDVANWVFEMPHMPAGATVLDARLQLNNQSGGAGSAMISTSDRFIRAWDQLSTADLQRLDTFTQCLLLKYHGAFVRASHLVL